MSNKHLFREETLTEEHVAVRAWRQLGVSLSLPTSVESLVRANGRPLNRKSRIYRLRGVDVPGDSVIAKLGRSDTIETERYVYEDVLPLIGVPFIRSFGSVPDSPERSWLFLEEARGARYDDECPSDRELAAETLARIHTATSEMHLAAQLPKHDVDRYKSCLVNGKCLIKENIDNPALSAVDKQILESILRLLEQVEQNWIDLGNALATMPQCLVHGDFVGKNVHVHKVQTTSSMYIMDWDISGWGAPAFDVERITPRDYRKYCESRWPHVRDDQIEFMAVVGRILRNVGLIQATSTSLCYEWVVDTMRELTTYERILRESLNAFRAT